MKPVYTMKIPYLVFMENYRRLLFIVNSIGYLTSFYISEAEYSLQLMTTLHVCHVSGVSL